MKIPAVPRGSLDPDTITFRTELILRDLRLPDLATAAGVSVFVVRHVHAGRSNCDRSRHKIEQALGVPIWHSHAEFSKRRDFIKMAGFDPYVLSKASLRAEARRRNIIRRRPVNSREKILNLLVEAITAQGNLQTGGAR
jgi:hypothetical protein